MGKSGRNIGKHGNHPNPATGKKRHYLPVFAGIHVKIPLGQLHYFQGIRNIPHCILHAHNVFNVPVQSCRCPCFNLTARPAWDIVHDNRDIHAFCHLGIIAYQTLLGRFVVVWRHHQKAVRPCMLGFLGQFYGCPGTVGTSPRNHGNPFLYNGNCRPYDFKVLIHGKGGGFACRACNNNAVGPILYLVFQNFF